MTLGLVQFLMLAAGAALAFIGLLLAKGRATARFSTPTRVVIGLSAAILGYHLIVWAFPPSLTPLQVSTHFWWVLLIAAVAAPLLSLFLDRRLAPRDPHDDSDAIR